MHQLKTNEIKNYFSISDMICLQEESYFSKASWYHIMINPVRKCESLRRLRIDLHNQYVWLSFHSCLPWFSSRCLKVWHLFFSAMSSHSGCEQVCSLIWLLLISTVHQKAFTFQTGKEHLVSDTSLGFLKWANFLQTVTPSDRTQNWHFIKESRSPSCAFQNGVW